MENWEKYSKREITYKESLRRIYECKETKSIELNLSWLDLKKIPPQIKILSHIRDIKIRNNKIKDISILTRFKYLTSLDLSNNPIEDINSLRHLTRLRELSMSNNKISNITPLKNLYKLKKLEINLNNITSVNPLSNLLNLRVLSLHSNKVSNLTPLKKLANLTFLDISGNNVKSIEVLRYFLKLNSVYLDYNDIYSITPIKHVLKPPILVTAETESSKPDSIYIDFTEPIVSVVGCPLVDPPIEIVKQGGQAILQYWEEIENEGSQKAYEGRLMIVGEGKVGKTTLLNKLKDPSYHLKELDQTHGINIWRDWKFPVSETEAEYNASVWDFGGQDIQHLTHQYFFTPGTVFLLVVNKRGSNAIGEASQLNYWFRIIELMGRYGGQKARVMVVHNIFAGDKSSQGINLGPYQKRYSDTLDISFKEVNLAEKSGAFDDLRVEIQRALLQLPGVGENIISGWPDIRRKLGERREERRIPFSEFGKICSEHNIIEESSQLLLIRYLARLGELLHYEHGGLLFDYVLLDINWITTAVYGITENQAIINRNGSFNRDEIIDIWHKNGVTNKGDHELMLQLLQMNAFELCWQTEKGPYLTPTLFSSEMPEVPRVPRDLGLRFHYEYLPKGLVGQLIVRLHKHLEKDYYWKDGIFLSREGCRAKVSRPLSKKDGERIIEVLVEGEAPRHYALLSLVVQELETIHERSFPRIRFRKEIPCPCKRCRSTEWEQAYFSYDQLLQLRQAGDQQATCTNQRTTKLVILLEGMAAMEQISPRQFAQKITHLIKNAKTRDALELLDRQYPSDLATMLLSRFNELNDRETAGLLSLEQANQTISQIKHALLKLANRLNYQATVIDQRKVVTEDIISLNSKLDKLTTVASDTNSKVITLQQLTNHVSIQLTSIEGELFASRKEERTFMNLLEEMVESLPIADQPEAPWYNRPTKEKIKLAFNLPILPGIIAAKWEKEMDTSSIKLPESWQAFKEWFIRE